MRNAALLLVLLPACVANAGPSTSDPDTTSEQVSTSGTTTIVNEGSRFCLDVANQSLAPGGVVQQWGCWGGPNQAFRLTPRPGGTYSVQGAQSGLCLGAGGSTANGARITQSPCDGGTEQEFAIREAASGEYTLTGVASGLCLGVAGGSTTNGAALIQWTCDGTPSQLFALTLPAGSSATGQDYYVSPSGRDTNDGHTPQTAWHSLSKVSGSSFHPGDAVAFERGSTFTGTLTVSSSGSTSRPITYGAYGQASTNPLITGGAHGISATARSWIVVRDLMIHDTSQQGIFIVAPSSDESAGCTNWVIDDIDFQGTAGGVFASFDSSILVENSVMHDGTAEFFYAWKGNDLHVVGNRIMTLYGLYTDNIQFEWSTNFEVRCNYATMAGSNSGKGNLIATDGSGGTVVDNTFVAGNYGFGDGDGSVTIRNNQFIDNSSSDSWSSAIKIAGARADGAANNDVDDVTIAHNLMVSPNKGIYVYDGNQPDPSGPGSRNNWSITGNVIENAKDATEIDSTLTHSVVSGNVVWTSSSKTPQPASPIVYPTSCSDGLLPHL